MHAGKSYELSEFLVWTRRNIYILTILGVVPVVLYQILGLKWLGIPWTAVALLGTATAFIVGFKNIQTYNRTWEARQIWGEITSSSSGSGGRVRPRGGRYLDRAATHACSGHDKGESLIPPDC